MIIYGKNPIKEAIFKERKIYRLYLDDKFKDRQFLDFLSQRGVDVIKVSKDKLNELSDNAIHQGVVADVSDYQYYDLEQVYQQNKTNRFIILENGSRTTQQADLSEIIYFDTLRIRLDTSSSDSWPKAIAWSAKDVIFGKSVLEKREFQRRLSGSISIFILILIIPALSHSKPRQGRFNKLIFGVIFYVIYFNILGMGLSWMKSGKIPPDIGLWGIQFIVLLLAFYIYKRYNRSL